MFDFCIVILNFLFKTAAKRANRMSRKRYKNAPQTAPSTRPVTRPARHPTPPKPSRQTPLRGPSPHPKTSPHPAPKRPVPGRPEPAPRGLTRRAAPLSERQPARQKSRHNRVTIESNHVIIASRPKPLQIPLSGARGSASRRLPSTEITPHIAQNPRARDHVRDRGRVYTRVYPYA